MSDSATIPAICIGGPTGSGKTALAIAIAKKLNCEIINVDSRQLYDHFPIITAQPTPEETAEIPHHLYGFLPLAEKCDAMRWRSMALDTARSIMARGKRPLFVGGTGFYFQALLGGLSAMPAIPDEIGALYAARLRELGSEKLHQELEQIDPEYASRIHPHDKQRVQRALEVYAASGKTFSWWHQHKPSQSAASGPLYYLAPTLDSLIPGLASRIDRMLACGALEETRQALSICPDTSAPGWSGIGCRECLLLLRKELDEQACRNLWLANTRAYAKRQLTWFRSRKNAVPITPDKISFFIDSIQ